MCNFDKIIDRRGTYTYKYDRLGQLFGRDDLLPLWVADMELATPDFIVDALKRRVSHPIFGYSCWPDGYFRQISEWIESHHGWKVEESWLTYIPGIVKGIGLALNYFLRDGDKVIIQPPVYHPFREVPENNGFTVVENPLIENADGSYSMDFENLEAVCDEHCKMLILCNPHNPIGIVWDRPTLERLASFCHSRGLIVISDEIHCDLTLYGHRHIPFASVSKEAAEVSITFGAPSKTFNIAGIVSSWSVISNPALRDGFYSWLEANELDTPTLFAPIATMAALTDEGEAWRKELISYLEGNIDYVLAYCEHNLPSIRAIRPEASFLVWLDCRGLGKRDDEVINLFVNKAHLALNPGSSFGTGGECHMRMNVAVPRKILKDALDRLRLAVCGY